METPKTAILYIGPRDLDDAFAGNADIVLESCRDVGAVPETIRRPDVVLMDSFAHSDDTDDLLSEARKWLGQFHKKRFRFPPAF
ncbi:MAG: hypothetical protein MI802_18430, partial [Desulfobacterales bacterium]|nr:hypothetical protein [Desulfobacterales bacterium]